MSVDVWGGFNQGMNSLNDTLVNVRQQDRQARLDDISAQAARQQLAMGGIQLENAQRQQTNSADLRAQLAAAQPVTTTSITPPTQTPQLDISATPGAQYLTNPPAPTAPTGSLQDSMQQAGLAEKPAPDASGFNLPQDQASPTVQAYNNGRVHSTTTAPDVNKIMLDHAMSTGDPARIEAIKQQIAAQAKSITDITGNPMAGLDIVNKAMGTNYSIMKTPDLELVKNGDEIIAMRDKGAEKQDIMNGMSLSDAVKKNMVPINLGGSSKVVADYLSSHKNATADDVWKLASDNNIPLKVIEPVITRIQSAENERGKDERQAKQFDHSEKMNTARQEHSDSRFAAALAARNQNNASTSDTVSSDAAAILKGDMAPSELGKRNGHDVKVRAEIRAQNPDFNFTQAEASAKLAKSTKIQDKAGNAAILPEMIKDVQDSGKKLDYSKWSKIGQAQQWWDKQKNNPDYINYSAKRNDIIMRIGGVMRENGMTDQAQKLEEDSAPRSMSPPAFDAWAKAQMSVLNPILNKYTSQATGKGTPGIRGASSGQPITTKGGFKVTVVQ